MRRSVHWSSGTFHLLILELEGPPPTEVKLPVPVKGCSPLATKWGPFSPPGWVNQSLRHYVPLLLVLAEGQWPSAPNWGPVGAMTGAILAEIFRIWKCLFISLFVCLFIDLFFFLFYSSWDTHRNIPWKFREDLTWFCRDIFHATKIRLVWRREGGGKGRGLISL